MAVLDTGSRACLNGGYGKGKEAGLMFFRFLGRLLLPSDRGPVADG